MFRMAFLAILVLGVASFISNHSYAHSCDGCGTHGSEKFCINCATGEKDCTEDSGHPRCKVGESD